MNDGGGGEVWSHLDGVGVRRKALLEYRGRAGYKRGTSVIIYNPCVIGPICRTLRTEASYISVQRRYGPNTKLQNSETVTRNALLGY